MDGIVDYDLCIVGAGMFGSAAARYASANPCLKVCLVGPSEPNDADKKTREIHSSYYDEGRIVCHASAAGSHATHVLGEKTIQRFQELEKLSGIQFYHPVGCLTSFEKNSEAFYMYRRVYENSKVPCVDISSGDTFKKRFPFLRLEGDGHVLLKDSGDGHVSPRRLVEAQQKVARLQGCHVIGEVVDHVSSPVDGLHTITTESGKKLRAKRILFCTGAFTKFKNLGSVNKLKITVHKETAVLVKVDQKENDRLSAMPTMVVFKTGLGDHPTMFSGAYVLPPILYPNGNHYLKIGYMEYPKNSVLSTLDEVKDWYNNDQGDPACVEEYFKFLLKIIPDLQVTDISAKVCVTCTNPTGLPYVDRLSPTVTAAVVGNGRGAMISDEVGRVASHLALTGQWDSELPRALFEAVYEEEPVGANGVDDY